MTRVFTDAKNMESVIQDVANAINSATGLLASVDVVDARGQITMRSTGATRYANTPLYESWLKMIQAPDHVKTLVLKDRKPVLLPDLPHDPRISGEMREFYTRASIVSGATFPLLVHDRIVGLLRVGSLKPTVFPPPMVALLQELAVQAAMAVHGIQLYAEQERAQTALRQSEERFRSLVQNASDMIVILDEKGTPVYTSPSVERIIGYRSEELEGINILSLIHPEDAERAAASLASVTAEPGVHPPTELRVRHEDGSWRLVEMIANNLLHEPAVRGIVYNARDVTDRRRAEEALRQSEERFRSLVQNASDLITVIEADTTVLYQSPSMRQVLGHAPDDIVGRKLSDFVHPDDIRHILSFLRGAMRDSSGTTSIEARLRHQNGWWRYVEIVGADRRHDTSVAGFVLNMRDVSERKLLEEQLRHQAFHDPLTNLANRASYTDRLEHSLLRATREAKSVAVVFMDIDNFKAVNDSLGHNLGDEVLVEVAKRVQSSVRPGDTTARFGGDEFAILLEDASMPEARKVTRRIIDALREPLHLAGRDVPVGASLGIAVSGPHDRDADALLRNADIAMYVAKEHGKGRFEIYEQSMHSAMVERLELLGDLHRALGRDEFVLHYQPMVVLRTGRVVGLEALVRWRHPTRGLLLPDQFIHLAEESGVIFPLGRWVLAEACRHARAWQTQYHNDPPFSISVNVSPRQLQKPSFAAEVMQILEETGLPPETLILEITESMMLADAAPTIDLLRQLRAMEVRIAIDDFGTGYSSLSYLRQIPFDILKIDQSFVADAGGLGNPHELTRAIVELGRTLHVQVVAEGIERAEQLAALQSLECELGQGYFFAQPVEPAQIDALLRRTSETSAA